MNYRSFFVLVLFFTICFQLSADIDDNWEAYYSFENNVEDSITDISGSFVNGAYRCNTSTVMKQGVCLDGVNDYVNLRNFDPAANGSTFSISFWSKSDSSTQGNHLYLGKHTSTGGNELLLGWYSGKFLVQMYSDYERVTTTEPSGQWVHWVVTFNSIYFGVWQTLVRVYKNGVLLDNFDLAGAWNGNTGGKPWVVGMDWDSSTSKTDHFDGSVDDIRFFSQILSADDVSALYARKHGFPWWLYTHTYAINDYETASDPERCIIHKETFVNTLSSTINSENYDDAIVFNHYRDFEDDEVTETEMRTTTSNTSEIVFFNGHGDEDGPMAWNSGSIVTPTEKQYGGDTKWAFRYACLTLKNGGSYLADAFDGVHAIFGFFSTIAEFRIWNSGYDKYETSEEMLAYFVRSWVESKEPMYEAWIEAIYTQIFLDGDFSTKAGAIQRRNTFDGKYVNGNYERIYDVYRYGMDSGGIWTNSVTWGTPSY